MYPGLEYNRKIDLQTLIIQVFLRTTRFILNVLVDRSRTLGFLTGLTGFVGLEVDGGVAGGGGVGALIGGWGAGTFAGGVGALIGGWVAGTFVGGGVA